VEISAKGMAVKLVETTQTSGTIIQSSILMMQRNDNGHTPALKRDMRRAGHHKSSEKALG
jgi:hypothetical protein